MDWKDYSSDPKIHLPQLHEEVAEILQNSGILAGEFSDFEVVEAVEGALELDDAYNRPSFNTGILIEVGEDVSDKELEELLSSSNCGESGCELAVLAELQNRTYQQVGIYGQLSVYELDESYRSSLVANRLLKFFNKVLRDQNSPYRLYALDPSWDERAFTNVQTLRPAHGKFGFIALTQAQKEVLFNDINNEFYSNPFQDEQLGLGSDIIEQIINSLEVTGLLSHLSRQQITLAKTSIGQAYIAHSAQILTAFNDIVLWPLSYEAVWYSTNLFSNENASNNKGEFYQALILELAKISRDMFRPGDLNTTYDEDTQTGTFSFSLNGSRYRHAFPSDSAESCESWNCLSEIAFAIASAAAEANLDGRFYQLNTEYSPRYHGYIFLTEPQYRALSSYGLFDIRPITQPVDDW